MTSPTLDSNANAVKSYTFSSGTGGSGHSLSGLATSQSPDILIVVIAYEVSSGSSSVSSITSSGLTFTKRSTQTNSNDPHKQAIEVWTAPLSSTLSSQSLYVTMSATIDDACVIAFAVNGVYSTSTPWDPNSGLPAQVNNTTITTPPTVTFSTTKPDDLLLFFNAASNGNESLTAPSGWTNVATAFNGGGLNDCFLQVAYKSVSSAQSGATVAGNTGNGSYWTSAVDALTADNPSSGATATVSMALSGVSMTAHEAEQVKGSSSFALTKVSFSVAETSHNEGGGVSMALHGVSFNVHESEAVSGHVSGFALTKASFNVHLSTGLIPPVGFGPYALSNVRGIRDTIPGGHMIGRLPGADGAPQKIPIAQVADQVASIISGGISKSPTNRSVGTKALAASISGQVTTAVAAAIAPNPVAVSALPAGTDGLRAFVTDSTQTLAAGIGTAVVGGSTHHVPVYYDGAAAAWMIG